LFEAEDVAPGCREYHVIWRKSGIDAMCILRRWWYWVKVLAAVAEPPLVVRQMRWCSAVGVSLEGQPLAGWGASGQCALHMLEIMPRLTPSLKLISLLETPWLRRESTE
jgi:hypothetical protein